jgi:hypothetical protein
MTSLPPTLPAFAAAEEVPELVVPELVVFELPPQALSTTDSTANNVTHLKRFIVTLSFQSSDRQSVAAC